MENMGLVDLILAGIIVISAVWGMMRGLTHQVISLASLIIAFFIAKHFAADFVPTTATGMINTAYYGISFACIFVLVFLIGIIVNFIVTHILNATPLAIVNKGLGAVFGAGKGFVIGMVIVYGCQYSTYITKTSYWKSSEFVPTYQMANNKVMKWLGEDITMPKLPSSLKEVVPSEYISF